MRVPLIRAAEQLIRANRKAVRTIARKNVSEHWKEAAVGAYAVKSFVATGKLALFLGLLAAAVTVFVYAAEAGGVPLFAYLLSVEGLIVAVLIATLYSVIRSRFA